MAALSIAPTSRPRARSMLFDLYGDFADEAGRGGALRLSALVRLAADLGVGEAGVRSAANRMVQDGWLAARRSGRESVFALSARGRQLVSEGRQRIFKPIVSDAWDGAWCAVALSVPEVRRELRDRLRKELSWLGFGSPSSGLYLSPRDHTAAVLRLAAELGASDCVQLYRAEPRWPADPREMVARAWTDLDQLDRGYAAFVARFQPGFPRDRTRVANHAMSGADAFRRRFELVHQFRACLFGDPDLPAELLPSDWRGIDARRLFLAYHELVTPPALTYFDAVSKGSP